jgi:PmbA protein
MGVASTGHACRGGYKGTLGVAPTNMYLEPGDQPFEALVAGPGPVVVIDDLQGLHAGTNAISGDFSLQCQGWLYVDGVEQHAVSNVTVAGNFVEMLAGVEALGNDLEFHVFAGNMGAPSVRIAGLAIAGA